MAKSKRLELGDNIYGQFRSVFNHCDVFGQESNQIRWKRKIRAVTSFKVIEVGISQKPVCLCDMINSNWHPTCISYRFGVIAAYCSNFGHCVFEPPFRGLRDNVRCSSWAHWEACSGLPISVNWTFLARCYGWGATGENR